MLLTKTKKKTKLELYSTCWSNPSFQVRYSKQERTGAIAVNLQHTYDGHNLLVQRVKATDDGADELGKRHQHGLGTAVEQAAESVRLSAANRASLERAISVDRTTEESDLLTTSDGEQEYNQRKSWTFLWFFWVQIKHWRRYWLSCKMWAVEY